jgi:hypothetical protein
MSSIERVTIAFSLKFVVDISANLLFAVRGDRRDSVVSGSSSLREATPFS